MGKQPKEWIKQAEYDLKTADIMLVHKRYIYAVFMCHLAIEKTLKGLFTSIIKKNPPKTHSLIFLIEKIGLEIPDNIYNFIYTLNGVSVPTRYPDDLNRINKTYNKVKTEKLVDDTKEALKWLKRKL